MLDVFVKFSLMILVVLGVSFFMRLFKQPLIIGYILSGILVGPFALNLIQNNEMIQVFSEIGIALLLFLIGLSLSPKVIKQFGKVSLLTGIGQIIFTTVFGFAIAYLLGFNVLTSLYISVALTFSSTIIIMKILSDKGDYDKLYGKITMGFLLVQDFVAIILLIVLSSFSQSGTANVISSILFKGIILMAIVIPISYFVIPKLSGFFAKSQEFLFLFAIAWGIGLAALFSFLGLTIEVGALIAGIMLSVSPFSIEISSKLKPLRDFFIISFFLVLGSQIIFSEISSLIIPAIVLSLFVLIGNPLILMIILGLLGYSKRTSFFAALTTAQVSEFSFILIAVAARIGQVPESIVSFITFIGFITIAGSAYLMIYSSFLYKIFQKPLSIFERKRVKEKLLPVKNYENILFGENRIGYSIMKEFIKTKNYLIADYNPVRVKTLTKKGINCVYGDASNTEFLDEIHVDKAQVIVSTIPEKEVNLIILRKVKLKNKNAVVIVTASTVTDVFELYKEGADYVILPQFIGGEYLADLIKRAGKNTKVYEKEKLNQINILKRRLK